jgi:hypothetical protein
MHSAMINLTSLVLIYHLLPTFNLSYHTYRYWFQAIGIYLCVYQVRIMNSFSLTKKKKKDLILCFKHFMAYIWIFTPIRGWEDWDKKCWLESLAYLCLEFRIFSPEFSSYIQSLYVGHSSLSNFGFLMLVFFSY